MKLNYSLEMAHLLEVLTRMESTKTKEKLVAAIIIPLLVVATVEKKTTRNVVEYFAALAR